MAQEEFLKRSIALSIVLHTICLLLLIQSNLEQTKDLKGPQVEKRESKQDMSPTPTYNHVTVIDPPKNVSDELIDINDETDEYGSHKREVDICKNFYGGIGVNIDPNTYKITNVMKFYPAWENGLMTGDIITSEDAIRGEIGTVVVLDIIRNGEVIRYNIIRDKICHK